MEDGGHSVTRAQFEENMAAKLRDHQFTVDIGPLLAHGYEWDVSLAADAVQSSLIQRLPGDPWKGVE